MNLVVKHRQRMKENQAVGEEGMHEQNKNISKKTDIIKQNQTEVLEMKRISIMKISVERFNIRFEQAKTELAILKT